MTLCECGCEREVRVGCRFIHGHNFKGVKRSKENCQNISKGLIGKKASPEHIEKNRAYQNRPEIKEKKQLEHTGKIISEETRLKLSKSHMELKYSEESKIERSKRMSGKGNHMYGKIPKFSGKRSYYESPLQGKVCFRSSYELAYAKYLDSKNILWMYEMETFDLGDSTYTPDFFLPKTEQFIEIKGYMRPKSQEKINKFLEQYPWNLEILREKDLIKLGIDVK